MMIRCKRCDYIWKTKPYLLLQNHGCPKCSHKIGGEKISLNHKQFCDKVEKVAPEIEIIGKYSRSSVKIECRCKTCGFKWFATPNNILRGNTGCSKCNRVYQTSFPEQAIYYYIRKYYPDAVNGYKEGFKNSEIDIFIPSLNIGIEYDGAFFHNSKTLDKEKRKYVLCREMGINLIRIRFEFAPDIADYIILTNNEKSKKIYMELDRIIDLLFKKIGSVNCNVNVENDRNEIYKMYLKTKKESSLLYKHPQIAREWHPSYNEGVTPDMVNCGSTSKFWWKCLTCNHEWKTTVISRTGKNHTGCPRCANVISRTHEEFLKELFKINTQIIILEKFKNTSTKILCECSICGHQWRTTPINLLKKKSGCPICAIENSKTSIEEIQNKITVKRQNIKILKYEGYDCLGEFECLSCGIKFNAISKSIINGNSNCPNCSKTRKLTNEEFIIKLSKINSTIIPLDGYTNMHTKIRVRCSVCDNVWEVKPASLIHSKTGCPQCYRHRLFIRG